MCITPEEPNKRNVYLLDLTQTKLSNCLIYGGGYWDAKLLTPPSRKIVIQLIVRSKEFPTSTTAY